VCGCVCGTRLYALVLVLRSVFVCAWLWYGCIRCCVFVSVEKLVVCRAGVVVAADDR